MGRMTSSEDVLLEMPNVKHKKDDGRLYVMSERLAWIQGNRDVVTVSHKYADIKSQKISPEGKPKIQLQVVLHDGSTYTFHFVNPEGAAAQFRDRDQVKELLIQLLPKFKRKINKELEEKNRLLSENPKLLQLYKDLVMDGIITPDEFWNTHAQHFFASQKSTTLVQDTGVSSGFLSDIHPETDGANGLRYNLTHDVIESIFKTYPAVKRKHIESVPAIMTESQFWTKFFQSHYFHRDRLPLLKDLFSDCAKADDKEMRREIEKVKVYNKDMMNILEDSEWNDSVAIFKDKEETKDGKDKDAVTPQGIYRNMIKRFNHHSIMVLKACERTETQVAPTVGSTSTATDNGTAGGANGSEENPAQPNGNGTSENNNEPPKKKKKKDKIRERELEAEAFENGLVDLIPAPEVKKAMIQEKVVYEDLKGDDNSRYTKLSLTRIDRYLNGPIPDYKTDVVTSDQISVTAQHMRDYVLRWDGKPRLLDSVTAVKILGELRPGGALMKGSQHENTIQTLPPEAETELRNMYASLNELLRHFWSCFPTSTQALEEKLQKTHETVKKFEQVKLQLVKDKLIRDHLTPGPLLSHALSLIGSVDTKYSQWMQRSRR